MGLIGQLMYYIHMIGICIIVTLIIVTAVLYYFLKIKKITATVENINTSYFRREDSISYVPFKDIASKEGLDSDGMYVINDMVFVGGISVRGFDYASASYSEKVDAQIQSVAFFNVVETPTSFRQSLKSVDLNPNIEEYEETRTRIAREQMELDAEYQATVNAADDYIDIPEQYEAYDRRMRELRREIDAKTHMLDECGAVISYMKALSGDVENKENAVGERTAQIMFSYVFNPDNYTEELTREEIYLKAQEALNTKAAAYSDALAYCHFKAKRLSTRELFGLMHLCTSPVTGEDADMHEMLDSSYTALYITSDSIVETMIEMIGEEKYKEKLETYEKELAVLLRQQQIERERTVRRIKEESMEIAQKEYALRWEGV